jgi:hypothetical protein
MRTLVFLSRVAVLMNVMFLLYLAGYYGLLPVDNNYLTGLIVTTGMGIAPILNLVLHPAIFVTFTIRRSMIGIPAWIIIFNLFCFIFQIFFYFIIK